MQQEHNLLIHVKHQLMFFYALVIQSKEESFGLVRAHASKPYSKLGMNLLFINCKITSSDAMRPIFPNIAFAER